MSNLILCVLCLSCLTTFIGRAGGQKTELEIEPEAGEAGVVTWTKGDKNRKVKCRYTKYSRTLSLMLIRQKLDGSRQIVPGVVTVSKKGKGFICITYTVAKVEREHAGVYQCLLISKFHNKSVVIAVAERVNNGTETTTPSIVPP